MGHDYVPFDGTVQIGHYPNVFVPPPEPLQLANIQDQRIMGDVLSGKAGL